MIKLRNICLRLSSMGLVSCLILALFLPVSAAGPYDFWDMNPTLTPDGSNTIVSLSVPLDLCYSRFQSSLQSVSGGTVLQFVLSSNESGTTYFFPFGYPFGGSEQNALSLVNIPNGALIEFVLDVSFFPTLIRVPVTGLIGYYDSQGNYLSGDSYSVDVTSPNKIIYSYTINKPAGADRITFEFTESISAPGQDVTFRYELLSTNLSMTLDSLIVQQQQTGRTNAILQKVEQQLADQGQTLDDVLKEQQDTNDKLDDIINGTVEPSSPAGSGAVEDLIDQEDQLLQDISPGLDDFNDITDTAMNGIGGYIGALMGVSWLIDTFINVPFIAPLVYLSLALGLTGTVLGIFNTYINAQHHKSDARSRRRE